MLLFNRRNFLTMCMLPVVAACGFTPVYGPGGSAENIRGKIALQAATDKNTFALVGRLENRLGVASNANYRLSYTLTTSSEAFSIKGSTDTERFQVVGELNFQLTEIDNNTIVNSGAVNSFTSYSTTGSTVGTLSAELDAKDRLMVILADLLVDCLLVTSADWAQ